MIFRKSPGILQEVGVPINKMIIGCNSDKKLTFFKKKVATSTFTEPIQFILNASEVWEVPKKSASFEEKETRVFVIALALTLTLALFQYPERTKVATPFNAMF
jgi:hypothetical protein